MAFKFDFADGTLMSYVGKTVQITFTDGDEMTCKVLGYTSAANNNDNVATVDVLCDRFDASVEITESEIASIELADEE